jgi:20S proteasome alpha/beta subunit
MTIALGVLGSNGIVIGADSEISTIDGEIKGVDTKIIAAGEAFEKHGRSLLVAGAGSIRYFQAVRFEVMKLVASSLGPDEYSDARVKANLENYMTQFHQKHITPYAKFKTPPSLSLLVATWLGDKGTLWASEMGTVTKTVMNYDAIGGGATYAFNFLHGYFYDDPPLMPFDSVLLFVLYVLGRVKANIAGCGQESHIAVISPGRWWLAPRNLIRRCEQSFEHFNKVISSSLYYSIGATEVPGDVHLASARSDFDELRQEIRAMSSGSSQT